jgi:microcystin-dependent protein
MSDQFIGEIRVFGGNFAILDWAFCQGQLQAIDQNAALFQLLGTTWGGDGVQTFGLPNLQNNLCVGQGSGSGLQTWVLGEMLGTSQVTLTQAQVPQHTHQATFADNVQFNYEVAKPTNVTYPGRLQLGSNYSAQTPTNAVLNPATMTAQGGSQPHDNTMPNLVMNYIIALFGIFPSQS